MNREISTVSNKLGTGRRIVRLIQYDRVPWGKLEFEKGDLIILRPVECRSRTYPGFMENRIFVVNQVKLKTVEPKCRCGTKSTLYHLDNCPRFTTHSQLIFLRYLSDPTDVVETDSEGHVTNGRFDAGDFVLNDFTSSAR